jgi:hypothetical protein
MANVNKGFKRFLAAGCVHSTYACKHAQDALMLFRERWKPEVVIDLGDVHDFTAFRSGAKGGKDESVRVDLDFNAGVRWLKRYRPTHRVNGNHDDRVHNMLEHPNAIIAHCAGKVIEDIRQIDEANKTLVRPYDQDDGWFTFGDTKFGHGWMFNEMAVRDHAETYGKCVIAHLHTPGEMQGRRSDRPTAWCVGTMADPKRMTYAKNWRGVNRWKHGFVWGEFNSRETIVRLERKICGNGGAEEWRLPL